MTTAHPFGNGDFSFDHLRPYVSFLKPFIAVIILWEGIVYLELVHPRFFPSTYDIAVAIWTFTANGEIPRAMWLTLRRALTALAIAMLVGVPLGLLMGRLRPVSWFFDPIVSIGFPIPKVTLIPVFLLWFGFGSTSKVLLASSDAVFPIVISTYAGTKGVDRELIWSARSMGLSRLKTIRKVVMPAALPQIFNGIQIALPLSFIIVIVSEMVMGGGGLGEVLIRSARFFETPKQYATLIGVAVLGLSADRIFRLVRSYFLRWT